MINTISYFIYLAISSFITIYVGWLCYKNGYVYVLELFDHDEKIAKSVNQLLLVAYYLLNIGFVFYSLSSWDEIRSTQKMIEHISTKVSIIVIILCILHYNNIIMIYLYRNYKLKFNK